jgi:hypothetical protein
LKKNVAVIAAALNRYPSSINTPGRLREARMGIGQSANRAAIKKSANGSAATAQSKNN